MTDQIGAPSMEPQCFCSLPWCGASFGGPTKVRIVDGERLECPEQIDAHHPFGRPGPVVYICHECHMAHHDSRRRLNIKYRRRWEVMFGGRWYPLRVADPCESA